MLEGLGNLLPDHLAQEHLHLPAGQLLLQRHCAPIGGSPPLGWVAERRRLSAAALLALSSRPACEGTLRRACTDRGKLVRRRAPAVVASHPATVQPRILLDEAAGSGLGGRRRGAVCGDRRRRVVLRRADWEAHSRACAEHRTLGEIMECRRRAGVPTMPAQHAAMNLGWTWRVLRRTGTRRRKAASAKDTDLPM